MSEQKGVSRRKALGIIGGAVVVVVVAGVGGYYAMQTAAPLPTPAATPKIVRFVFAPDLVGEYIEDSGIYAKWESVYNTKIVTASTWDDFAFFMGHHADIASMGLIEAADLEYETGEKCVAFGKYNKAHMQMCVQIDSPYETLEDLKGKVIGIGSWGGGDVAVWQVMAKKMHGLSFTEGGDFKFVVADYGLLGTLLANGELDAASTNPTFGAAPFMEGKVRALYDDKSQWQIYKDWTGHDGPTFNMWIAWKDWIDANPDAAEFMVAAWQEGEDAFLNNMEGIIRLYPELAGVMDPENDEEIKFLVNWIKGHNLWYEKIALDDPEWGKGEQDFTRFAQEVGAFPPGIEPVECRAIIPTRKA